MLSRSREELLATLYGEDWRVFLSGCLRRRRLGPRALLRVEAEEIRQATALEILGDGPTPRGEAARRRLLRRLIGRSCYRLVEREERFERRSVSLEAVVPRLAAVEGADGRSVEWEERVSLLPPEERALLDLLLERKVPALGGGLNHRAAALEAGIDGRRLPFRIARLLRTLLGREFLEEALALLRRRLLEIAGAGDSRLPPLGRRDQARARLLARGLRRLPVDFEIRRTAATLLRLEREEAKRFVPVHAAVERDPPRAPEAEGLGPWVLRTPEVSEPKPR